MTPPTFRSIALLAALSLAACKVNIGGTTGPGGGGGSIASVVLSPPSAMIGVGETVQLTATAYDAAGSVLAGATFTWETTHSSAATVAPSGPGTANVTGVGNGGTTITATATQNGKFASVNVNTATVPFVSVSVGVGTTCALTNGGAAYCWGDNSTGELGIGTADTLPHPTPEAVHGGLTFTALEAGGAGHVCGLVAGGTMYCWGDNSYGELGIGSVDAAPHPSPVAVTGGHTFASFVNNGPYTCALDTAGAAWCWGDGGYGELGSASLQSGTPIAVGGGLTFVGIAGGNFHVCAAISTGAGYCWGRNNVGQLGIGSTDSLRHTAPAAVLGGLAFTAYSGGGNYGCGVSGGVGYCWGGNFAGHLGTGAAGKDSVPTAVSGSITWRAISASNQTCGVSTANIAYCWGDNASGELGIATTDTLAHPSPAAVFGGLAFTSISANRVLATCGLTTGGRIYCWGDNTFGELGNGTVRLATTPVRVLAQP